MWSVYRKLGLLVKSKVFVSVFGNFCLFGRDVFNYVGNPGFMF
jgi:hypothetical protein